MIATSHSFSPISTNTLVLSDIYDGDNRVCTVYWSCPWGSKSNSFYIQNRNKDYGITPGDWNQDSGALGEVDVDISRKG